MNAATIQLRVAEIAAGRRRTRAVRYTSYALIAALVLWSIEAIVVRDTDWSRIVGASLFTTLGRFLELD